MSGIFARLFSWLANDIIIHTLSNSKRFQQFAMRTDASLNKHKSTLETHVLNPGEKLVKEHISTVKKLDLGAFAKTFRDEINKELKKKWTFISIL